MALTMRCLCPISTEHARARIAELSVGRTGNEMPFGVSCSVTHSRKCACCSAFPGNLCDSKSCVIRRVLITFRYWKITLFYDSEQ
jgi:hypothetical protein